MCQGNLHGNKVLLLRSMKWRCASLLGCSKHRGSEGQVKADMPGHPPPPSTVQPQGGQVFKGPSVPDFLAVLCTPPAPGLPGEPVFLLNRLLKKLANTPSLAALSKEIIRNRSINTTWMTQTNKKLLVFQVELPICGKSSS